MHSLRVMFPPGQAQRRQQSPVHSGGRPSVVARARASPNTDKITSIEAHKSCQCHPEGAGTDAQRWSTTEGSTSSVSRRNRGKPRSLTRCASSTIILLPTRWQILRSPTNAVRRCPLPQNDTLALLHSTVLGQARRRRACESTVASIAKCLVNSRLEIRDRNATNANDFQAGVVAAEQFEL